MSEQMPSLGYMPPLEQAPAKGVALRQALRIWRRHMRLFFACFFGVLIVGAGVLVSLKPTYTATATVAIPPQSTDPLAPSGQQQSNQVADDLPATYAAMMQSRDIAAAVLAQVPPVAARPGFSLRATLCHAGLSFACAKRAPADPQAERQSEINGLLASLSVVPQLNSRAIDVSVTAASGPRAAMLADAVVTNFQRIGLARQTANLNHVSDWLDARTAALQKRWLDAVNAADAYSVSHGLTNAGAGGATPSPLVDTQIANMAGSLATAQAQLAAAQAREESLRDASTHGDPSALLTLSEQPILVAAATTLMQLQSQRDQLAAEYGADYPKIRALDRQIAATRATVSRQTTAALASIRATLVSARAEVRQLNISLDKLRAQAGGQSADQAEYRSLNDEAQSARTIYETFLEHANEIVDRAALLEPPVTFVSHAGIPSRPTFPNKPKLVLGIFVVAVVVGLAAAFLRDYFSVGFAEAEDLRASVPLPLLASLPLITARRNRPIASHVLDDPFSRTSEAVRGLAAKLSLLAVVGNGPRSVLVTSASAMEGKSTLAFWLAMTVRQGGQSVLVLDGDHRRGSLMRDVAKPSKPGLTDMLSGRASSADVIQTDPVTGIDFIAAGSAMSRPFGPEEIVRLRGLIGTLKRSYSLVVIDSPPLLAMTDGFVYGSVADQTVFVCRWQQTSRAAVSASVDRLRAFGAAVAGIVVSMVDQNSTMAFGGDYSRRETRLISRLYGS